MATIALKRVGKTTKSKAHAKKKDVVFEDLDFHDELAKNLGELETGRVHKIDGKNRRDAVKRLAK